MSKNVKSALIQSAVALLIAALSLFCAGKMFVSPNAHAGTMSYLDEKKAAVLELTGAATVASVAISIAPGDIASPIAEKFADLISYLLIIVTAIVLEKYLITVAAYAAFYFLIPIGCFLYILYAFTANVSLKRTAMKLAAFGLAIFLLVPVSTKISMIIDETYKDSAQSAIENAKQGLVELEKESEEGTTAESGKSSKNLLDKIADSAGAVVDSIGSKFTVAKETLQASLNNFIDAIAILIVTSCIMPIAVLLVFLWLIKLMFGLNIDGKGLTAVLKKNKQCEDE